MPQYCSLRPGDDRISYRVAMEGTNLLGSLRLERPRQNTKPVILYIISRLSNSDGFSEHYKSFTISITAQNERERERERESGRGRHEKVVWRSIDGCARALEPKYACSTRLVDVCSLDKRARVNWKKLARHWKPNIKNKVRTYLQ